MIWLYGWQGPFLADPCSSLSSGLGFAGGRRLSFKTSFLRHLNGRKWRTLQRIWQGAFFKLYPKSSKTRNCPQIKGFWWWKSHLPGHPFSSPATEGRYQNRGSKKYLLKAQLVQSLELSAVIVRKVYGTETAATFWRQNHSQGKSPKRETVTNSTSVRQQFYTLETSCLQNVEL